MHLQNIVDHIVKAVILAGNDISCHGTDQRDHKTATTVVIKLFFMARPKLEVSIALVKLSQWMVFGKARRLVTISGFDFTE